MASQLATKAKRRRLLPSIESVSLERERSKARASEVVHHFEALSSIELQDVLPRRQKNVTESARVCWLMCKVLHKFQRHKFQRCNALAEQSGITTEDATFLQAFVKDQCPSLLRIFGGFSDESECTLVLGPPTCVCYECGSNLVSYHQCQVRYYTTVGVKKGSLRCIDCQLMYNYSMFGNKRELGFRYYPEARKIV